MNSDFHKYCLLLIHRIAIAAFVLGAGACLANDLDDANRAWNDRIRKIKSAEIRLEKTAQMDAGYWTRLPLLPKEERLSSCLEKIIWNGERVRYEFDGYVPILGENDVAVTKQLSVFDGAGTKTWKYIEGTKCPSQGSISSHNTVLVSVVAGYMPVVSILGCGRETLDLLKGARVVPDSPGPEGNEESDSELIVEVQRGPRSKIWLWLDKNRDYVPVRYSLVRNGEITWQIDVEYEKNEEVGWVPGNWRYTSIVGGNRRSISDWKVFFISINPTLPADSFSVDFPQGTMVCETRGDSEEIYIVGKDNVKEPVEKYYPRDDQ